jgi:hypothetical protein
MRSWRRGCKCAADAGDVQALYWRTDLPGMHSGANGRSGAIDSPVDPHPNVARPVSEPGETNMKSGRLAVLAVSLLTTAASTASAAPVTANGPAALALAGVVALYSPLLTADEREAVSAFFVGQSGVRYARKISVTADKIVCKVSNVDITARSCELTFKGNKQTITGRRASEVFATEAMAGVPPDGAAGSIVESLSKLTCTLDPAEIRQKAGGGASCSFETGN